MSNQIHHNKWHGFNHHTQPTIGFPDSSTDPIASLEYPFKGIFYNFLNLEGLTVKSVTITSTGSGYSATPTLRLIGRNPNSKIIRQGTFRANINTGLKTITSVDVLDGGQWTGSVTLTAIPTLGDTIIRSALFALSSIPYTVNTNSFDWWFYSTLTKNYSADWSLWNNVKTTTIYNSAFWELGYNGYTNLIANSSNFNSVFTSTNSLSAMHLYDGTGGTGWHIALSSITHRLNTSAINTRQKVAVPVKLFDSNLTLAWNTTAQTVFYNVTGNYALTARDISEAKKGGKYTMWLYIDRCPQEKSNVIFDPNDYTISVKTKDNVYQSHDNVLTLSARHITRIDFVYDGQKMLGKATDYFIDLPTTYDTYYRGTGIIFYDSRFRKRNPIQVNGLEDPKEYIAQGTGTIINKLDLTEVPASNSLYIPGTGIKMRFLGADQQYFSFNLFNAVWPTSLNITKFPVLTSSFDRVIGLSGGSWLDSNYGYNLLATPVSADTPPEILEKFKEPNYILGPSNLITLKQCTSTYTIEIYSGKDRFIDSVVLNGVSKDKVPIIYGGQRQPFNFLNEETATLSYERVQEDQDIEVTFNSQPAISIPGCILWFSSMDDTLFNENTINVDKWYNNANYPYFFKQDNTLNRPPLNIDGSLRGVYLNNNNFLTLNTSLTSLSSNNGLLLSKPFSTVFVVDFNSFPSTSILWWLGNFSYNGYGLVMRDDKLYTRPGTTDRELVDGTSFEPGKKYVITTIFDGVYERIFINNRVVSKQSRRKIYRKPNSSVTSNYSDLSLTLGRDPIVDDKFSNLKLYDFILFEKALTVSEINRINLFYVQRINGYKSV